MRKLRQVGAVAIALMLVVTTVPSLTAADSLSVGQFVQQIAQSKGVDSSDVFAAENALARVGVRLPADLDYNAQLTEGDVSAIARTLGINVRSGNPDASFSSEQASRFLASFQEEIVTESAPSSTPDFDLFDDLVSLEPGEGQDEINGNWFWWWKGWFPGYWWSKWQEYWAGKWKGKWKGKGKGGKGKKTKKDPH